MKTIKFGNVVYDLVYDVVAEAASIRVTIPKGNLTLADVAPVVQGVEEIQVIGDDGTVLAIYKGYTRLTTLNLYTNYPLEWGAFGPVISIELQCADVVSQIDALTAAQETQGAEIADIEEAVDELTESQGTQDLAIEDLAEAVNDLTPEEE